MNLFNHADENSSTSSRPLADQMRPQDMESMLGQSFLEQNSLIRTLLETGKLPSLILWGPPGTGKTSFAKVLANSYGLREIQVNAVSTGAKELRSIGEAARSNRLEVGERSLLFVDEIHRLNRAQQDVLLPFVEQGDLVFIGATTENPSFQVNSALMSRCRLVKFDSLSEDSLVQIITKTAKKKSYKLQEILSDEALVAIARLGNGDARKCLNLIEQIFDYFDATQVGRESIVSWPMQPDELDKVLPAIDLYFDRDDEHYDTASALIKSIRASDPDASIYYLARMIAGGEDPKFIARRLIISASEDVGNADPKAVGIAMACAQAVDYVGLPEAGINLAQAVTYLASAPKSNRSYLAYKSALDEVGRSGNLKIPFHLRNAPTKLMKNVGYGKAYQYAHNFKPGELQTPNLPSDIEGLRFYEPKDQGYEKHIAAYLDYLGKQKATNAP